jgi:hypothetical protein
MDFPLVTMILTMSSSTPNFSMMLRIAFDT